MFKVGQKIIWKKNAQKFEAIIEYRHNREFWQIRLVRPIVRVHFQFELPHSLCSNINDLYLIEPRNFNAIKAKNTPEEL